MDNVYYDPQNFGLETVGEIEFSSGSYEFDLLVVWRDAEGNLYYAMDSGCSCPSPFEEISAVSDLTPATPMEIQAAAEKKIADDEQYSWTKAYVEGARTQMVNLMERLVK